MSKTQSLTITLPDDLAEWIERKVASGEYASESQVVAESLREMAAEDAQIERWLTEEVLPTYDRLMAGNEKTLTPDEVRRHIDVHMELLVAKRA